MIYDGVITKPPIEQLLMHSGVKGMEWKNHKYIRKANGEYYYPEGSYRGAKFSEYKKGDSDFDRKNFSEKNRVGDSEFFFFTRPDGKVVVLEEDMKWELPEGTKLTPEMTKRLEEFNKDGNLHGEDWNRAAMEAITGQQSDGKLSDKDKEDLSNMVIRGEFNNGKDRKDLLGEHYQEIQDLVNQKLKGKSSSKSETSKSEEETKDDSDYEVKEGNNHYKYKVKKKK